MATASAPLSETVASPAPIPELDTDRLMGFVGKAVGDFGALVNGALVVVGDRLGFYRALAGAGALTPEELAERTGTRARYAREWLNAQATAGYVTYEGDGRYRLPAEHAVALTDETSPAFVVGGFQLGLASVRSADALTEAFRTGAGIGWGEHDADLYPGCERLFGPSYRAFLASAWIPALDGVHDRLLAGGTVADIGCGYGTSTIVMAQAYPSSSFIGFDPHPGSVEAARLAAEEAGVADRVRFEVAAADGFAGRYDLVTFCDALHDMGDPVGAARHARSALADDGTLMVVEPIAGDRVEENQNPIGAAYYAFSNFLCTPGSIAQPVGLALGAQAGEARLRDVLEEAGFGSVRRVAESPLNMVLEAKP
ncbi:MAG: class I SAM-dependent methyltransferase [Chloroflexi bacterium]|nr:class I SAM-dependent methyltransferase [Chloroflexota bacterium]